MGSYKSILESVKSIADNARGKKIAHLYAKTPQKGKISVSQKTMINFGSCSYLGLEYDERLKNGSKLAIDDYGTQFSASRAYVSCGLYEELERNLEEMTKCNVVVTPTTTLGHISTIPVVVGDDDVVVLDHQVHASVQTAVQLLKARGIKVEMIRHNNMEMLEARIIKLQTQYSKVWYMADGIYSMYGDSADMIKLNELMNKYPSFYLYIDDAHGTSCFGENGVGYVLSQITMHKQMIVAISLNKAFASGGGAILFSDFKTADMVRSCGGPMITSGPMQPASLGAAIAASKIHLSTEMSEFQTELSENIKYSNLIIKKLKLPIIAVNESPIFFIGISQPKLGYELVSRMKKSGFYMNIGIFPAVPIKNTGVRFTITRLHTFKQIDNMLNILAKHYFQILNEENYQIDNVYKAFKLKNPEDSLLDSKVENLIGSTHLKVERLTSVSKIDKNEWDALFNNKGAFNYDTLLLYENVFSMPAANETKWDFDYIVIRDFNNEIILATFLTTSLQKDDIFSAAEISKLIEKERRAKPFYLTSRVLSVGCGLSIGDQVYINEENPLWKNALDLFINELEVVKEKRNAEKVMLRGFKNENIQIQNLIEEKGYFSLDLPENNVIQSDWNNEEEFLLQMKGLTRKRFKQQIKKEDNNFILKKITSKTKENVEHLYSMYLNVWNKNKDLNTFPLPFELFIEFSQHKDWNIVELFSKNNTEKSCGVLISHLTETTYSPLIFGANYNGVNKGNLYKFLLYSIAKESYTADVDTVFLGITNSSEKRKIGAKQYETKAYFQVADHYNDSVVDTYSNQVKLIKV